MALHPVFGLVQVAVPVHFPPRRRPLVVTLVISGFPLHRFGRELTPRLWELAHRGAWRPDGGQAVLAASTCPNMLTLVTATGPARHGIYADSVIVGEESLPAWTQTSTVPTLFDIGWQAGRRMVAVLADSHLVPLLAAERAEAHWPSKGRFSPSTRLDERGCAQDAEVGMRLLHAIGDDVDFVLGQFSGVATAGEEAGPDSDVAQDAIIGVDCEIGRLVERLERRWGDVVLCVLSDHDEEPVLTLTPFDLADAVQVARLPATVVHNGAMAFVGGHAPKVDDWLRRRPELMGCRQHGPGLRSVWLPPGSWFGTVEEHRRGVHGGPSAASQLAIVAGGHGAATRIGGELGQRRPGMADWGATLAELLDLELTAATGSSLAVASLY